MDLSKHISDFAEHHQLPISFCVSAERYFAPLAISIANQSIGSNRPLLVGINGCQGSGKSTLNDFLLYLLNTVFNCHAVGMSIDDFYLTQAERVELSHTVHPLLVTRGVPGTHDTQLIRSVLNGLCNSQLPVSIPVFDKAIDDRVDPSNWTVVSKPVQVILFEGWCIGAQAEPPEALIAPINSLEALEDPDATWRRYSNDKLSNEYADIFAQFDRMVMLKAPGFHTVKAWRFQQEQRLLESVQAQGRDTSMVMTQDQVERFIQHYERVTVSSLATLPFIANDLFELDEQRTIVDSTLSKGL